MAKPVGTLTPAQLEVMEAVWDAGADGATVAEIWARIAQGRDVARTTVLTLVGRLERRGWLLASNETRGRRYRAARSRAEAAGRLAGKFVDDFFGGSASQLVMSLLGSNRLDPHEVRRLRRVLAEAEREDRP
jgi:predicted transcriptional regulator